jgi:hypothetical protein
MHGASGERESCEEWASAFRDVVLRRRRRRRRG